MSAEHSFLSEYQLRRSQALILEYEGGYMGISAVPGSGKTWTLSLLAAKMIASGALDLNQEVLIVTLVNSAVDNFARRIGGFIQKAGLLPNMSHRVRTLHGLAHDIVRERPGLVNLANDFTIIDDREAESIRSQVAEAWLRANPTFFDDYLKEDLNDYYRERARRTYLPDLVKSMAIAFIRIAKDRELTPEALRQRLDQLPSALPLAEMGCQIYQEYQRALNYRGAVDFDDLIRLALAALRSDPALTERLRQQWPLILEDEAQDSSRLQEEILRLLAGGDGHWVRVGDPNQAIFETFTTANPQYLLDFIQRREVTCRELPESGRSMTSIIDLANYLIQWTREAHPVEAVQTSLALPYIQPTGPDDPQPNPPNLPEEVYFSAIKRTPAEEIAYVVEELLRWQAGQNQLPETERETLAVLAPRNQRSFELVDALRDAGVDPVDNLLRSTTATRMSAGALGNILRYLADPRSPSYLSKAFRVWRRIDRGEPAQEPRMERLAKRLAKLERVEDYLYPLPGQDWLEESGLADKDPHSYQMLLDFRTLVRRWHSAALLPIDQVLLTLAQDLFTEAADLAVAHKLAQVLRQISDNHPSMHLPELSEELASVARNERRFIGFSEDDSGFDPERYKGRVVVSTIHKAKGLEWDRVWLLSVNTYDFPSGLPEDQYISEKWFIRGQLNLEAEAVAQLKVALSQDVYEWYEEGQATQAARLEYVRERLRLLYVAITRARKGLTVLWNTGRKGDLQPALPFLELQNFWNEQVRYRK